MNWLKLKWKLIHFKRKLLPVKVLDTLHCKLTCSEDGVGTIRLVVQGSDPLEELIGEKPLGYLRQRGITEDSPYFWTRVIDVGRDCTKMEMEPIFPRELTKEEDDKICREIDEALDGLDTGWDED